jgi:hypothetical protein
MWYEKNYLNKFIICYYNILVIFTLNLLIIMTFLLRRVGSESGFATVIKAHSFNAISISTIDY